LWLRLSHYDDADLAPPVHPASPPPGRGRPGGGSYAGFARVA
jgi:hypothetical protein